MKTFLIKTWDIESCNMNVYTQKTFTCLKSAEAAQEKGVKYVQSQQKRHQNDVTLTSFWWFYC